LAARLRGAVGAVRLARFFDRLHLDRKIIGVILLSGNHQNRAWLGELLRIPKPAGDFADGRDRLAAFSPQQITEYPSTREAGRVDSLFVHRVGFASFWLPSRQRNPGPGFPRCPLPGLLRTASPTRSLADR